MEGPLDLVCIEPHIILLSAICGTGKMERQTEPVSTVSFRKSVIAIQAATGEGVIK